VPPRPPRADWINTVAATHLNSDVATSLGAFVLIHLCDFGTFEPELAPNRFMRQSFFAAAQIKRPPLALGTVVAIEIRCAAGRGVSLERIVSVTPGYATMVEFTQPTAERFAPPTSGK
jgi:hypothetical protein